MTSLFCITVACVSVVAGKRCDVPADVVFLMDASDSITETQWEEERNFVLELIESLEVERTAIHVGVIVYSTNIGLVRRYTTVNTGRHDDLRNSMRAVE
ncbi:von Willebrand factor [Elysia marginata]|uniref:von Willebrand factor n=1 Tax=Elysia marginata TaxID=1093978 RepID=A0AAV4I5Y0_9GAST|nr:von Willebrand factor [Elysia marginata]